MTRARATAAPPLGRAEIADGLARIEREMQGAGRVARPGCNKGAVGAKADDVRNAVGVDIADEPRRL